MANIFTLIKNINKECIVSDRNKNISGNKSPLKINKNYSNKIDFFNKQNYINKVKTKTFLDVYKILCSKRRNFKSKSARIKRLHKKCKTKIANPKKKDINSANKQGTPFEEYIKDLFAGSLHYKRNQWFDRFRKINNAFSYTGNNTNPPDAVLRGYYGDAIEFKKQSKLEGLQLNSSYFHHDLRRSDKRITDECRKDVQQDLHINKNCDWYKEISYIIGRVTNDQLKSMIIFFGRDYANKNSKYKSIENSVSNMIVPSLWENTLKSLLASWYNFRIKKNNKNNNINFDHFKKSVIKHLSISELQNICTHTKSKDISVKNLKLIMFYANNSYRDHLLGTTVNNVWIPKIWKDTISEIIYLWYKDTKSTVICKKNFNKIHYKQNDFVKDVIKLLEKSKINYINPSTDEIGRINNVDNIGTYLRVRGMWVLPNPVKIINSLIQLPQKPQNTKKYHILLSMRRSNGKKKSTMNFFAPSNHNFSLALVIDKTRFNYFKNAKDFKALIKDIKQSKNNKLFISNLYIIPIELKYPDTDNKNNTHAGYIITYTFDKR